MKRCFITCLLVTGFVRGATAQSSLEGVEDSSMQIRHLVVSPAELEARIGEGSAYRPLPRNDYERLVEKARGFDEALQGPPQTRLLEARYRARLVDDYLQEGVAELDLACDASKPVPLTLEPLSIAVGQAQWQAAGVSRRAVLGADPKGQAVVVVGPQDQQLQFAWSARGRRTSKGLDFFLRFPRANVQSLHLELPKGLRPAASIGVVDKPLPAGQGYQRWDLYLGANNALELSLLEDSREGPVATPGRTRQETRYEVSESGVVIGSQLELYGMPEELEALQLEIDEGVRVLDVSLGNLPVAWTISDSQDGQTIRAELPRALPDVSRLTVNALATLDPGKAWQLPRIRPLGVFWESGIAQVHMYHPLEIQRIQLEDCRITSNHSDVASPDRTSFKRREIELQFFDRDARAQLVIGPVKGRLRAETAQVVRWSAEEYRLIAESDWKLSTGYRFQARLQVPTGWEVVDVETPNQPARVETWNVHRGTDGSQQILELHLARALSAESTLHTRIQARLRNLGANEPFGSHPLPTITPLEVDEQEGVLDYAVVGPYQADFEEGDGLEPFDIRQPGERSDKWRGLLPEAPAGTQFYFDGREHEGRVQVIPTMPTAKSEVEGWASLTSGGLLQQYNFRYEFEEVASDRVLVYFANPTGEQVQWTSAVGREALAEARVLKSDLHNVWKLPRSGELWEVRIPPTSRSTIELTARIQSPLDTEATLNLPWPLGNEPAQTRVRVFQETTSGFWQCKATGVRRLPLAVFQAGTTNTGASAPILGAYSYDRPDAQITVHLLGKEAISSAPIIWQAKLESLLAKGGHQDHRLTLELSPAHASSLSLKFSDGQRVRGAWVDGKRTTFGPAETTLRLPLPKNASNTAIVVEYEAEAVPLSWLQSVTVALPRLDVPVAAFRWHLAVPHDNQVLRIPSRLAPLEPAWGHRTWSQRLFGPFGRRKGAARFKPLDLADWRSVFLQEEPPTQAGAGAEMIQDLLLGFPGENRSLDSATLADFLSYLALPAARVPPLLVDAIALEEAGWDVHQTLVKSQNRQSRDTDSDRSPLPLRSMGLAVLITSDAWVLTTAQEVERLQPWLRVLDSQGVFEVEPSPLGQQIADAVLSSGERPERFQYALDWDESAGSGDVATVSIGGETFAEQTRGWKVLRMSGMGLPRDLKLRFWTRPSATLFAVSLFLVTLLVATVTSRLMPGASSTLNLGAILIAWSLALIVPEPVSPLCAAVALGSLVFMLGSLLRVERSSRAAKRSPVKSTLSTLVRPAAVGLLFLVVGWVARHAWAQSPNTIVETTTESLEETRAPNLQETGRLSDSQGFHNREYLVLVPANGNDDDQGDSMVYVPRRLLEVLRSGQTPSREAFVLAGGRYEAEMGRQEAVVRVHLDVYAFDRGGPISVTVPIDPEQLVPGSTRLNGERVRPLPLQPKKGVAITMEEPGLHELELRLRAPVHSAPGGPQAKLRVPPLPQALLELVSDDGQAPASAPEARGRVEGNGQPRSVAEMGAVENLILQRLDPGTEPGAPQVSLRCEMLWELQPKTVELKAQFHYRVAAGSVTQFTWLLDSSLEAKRVGSPSLETTTSLEPWNEKFNLLTIHLEKPQTGAIELQAEFNVRDAEGIGRLWLPQLEPRNVDREDVVMAIPGNPQIDARVTHAAGATPLAPEEFRDRWDRGPLEPLEQPPAVAYRLDRNRASIALANRPPQPEKSVVEAILLRPQRERLELVYIAVVTTEQAPSFQHRFGVSPAVRIDEVSVVEGDSQRLDHWSRDSQTGEVTLFLAESTTGSQWVQFRGWVPLPLTGEFDLPCFQSLEGSLASGRTLIAPDASHDVVLDKMEGLEPVSLSADDHDLAEGAWVAEAYRFESRDYAARVRVVPNESRVHAIQKLALERRTEAWHLTAEILYQIAQGRAHHFEIRLPAELSWDERNVVTPGLKAVRGKDRRSQRVVTVVPEQPVEKTFRVQLQGTLSLGTTEVPDVRPLGVDRLEQYLVFSGGGVPGDGQVEKLGLEPTRLPRELSDDDPAVRRGQTYRVLRPEGRLPLPSPSREGDRSPTVLAADLRVAFDPHGKVWGEAEYTLRLPSPRSVEFQWPPSARLFEVTVDRRPIPMDWKDDETLALLLAGSDFPQRVVIRWNQKLARRPASLDRVKLDAPMPKSLSVGKTWWTVRGPNGFQQFEPDAAVTVVDLGVLDFERLETIVLEELSIREAFADNRNLRGQRELIEPWLRRFDHRFAQVQSYLNAAASSGSTQHRRLLNRLGTVLEKQRQWEVRLGIEDDRGQRNVDVLPADSRERRLSLQPGTHWSFSFAGKPVSTLSLWNVRRSLLRRTLVGMLLAGVVLAGWLLSRKRDFLPAPRNGRLFKLIGGCGIGLAWWWWLEPSEVGLALSAGFLIAAVWEGWRSHSSHDDSVVLIVPR